MESNRRLLIKRVLIAGVTATMPGISSGQFLNALRHWPSGPLPKSYAKLDVLLKQSVFMRELYKDPVIIESVDLLHYKNSVSHREVSRIVEIHEVKEDVTIVQRGETTPVPGGTGTDLHPSAPQERQGTSIECSSIPLMSEIHISEPDAKTSAPVDQSFLNELSEGGLQALDPIPKVSHENLQVLADRKWERQIDTLTWTNWIHHVGIPSSEMTWEKLPVN
jgi:hypothetical protein